MRTRTVIAVDGAWGRYLHATHDEVRHRLVLVCPACGESVVCNRYAPDQEQAYTVSMNHALDCRLLALVALHAAHRDLSPANRKTLRGYRAGWLQ